MKYLFALMSVFLSLTDCYAESFMGQTYQLTNAPMPVTLAFDAEGNRYHGQALNNYFGTYDINGQQIKFNLGGSTMMAGAPEEMQAERDYYTVLEKVMEYQLQQNQLILITSDGQKLIFEKQ